MHELTNQGRFEVEKGGSKGRKNMHERRNQGIKVGLKEGKSRKRGGDVEWAVFRWNAQHRTSVWIHKHGCTDTQLLT
jgi:hypothetical protein